ncbi:hypothetical protein PoB_000521500 [Plakobranchus ocellatus]|uniref:Uncharacterized protein n=1 Tax=Plakobranchus ocellatus TaxID=259542 RepID=A0AAV3Y6I2_9GAST|nr:hypothetical protein PoB_000521500 [Plakobranchus ocellatus]
MRVAPDKVIIITKATVGLHNFIRHGDVHNRVISGQGACGRVRVRVRSVHPSDLGVDPLITVSTARHKTAWDSHGSLCPRPLLARWQLESLLTLHGESPVWLRSDGAAFKPNITCSVNLLLRLPSVEVDREKLYLKILSYGQ